MTTEPSFRRTLTLRSFTVLFAVVFLMQMSSATYAQQPDPAAASNVQAPPEDDPDRDLNRAQPDYALLALPTTLRLPRHESAFRVTHRFGRPLGQGDFGSLASDFFSLDSGGQIGLEYRYGLFRGLQLGIHRMSNRTIQFFTQYSVKNQRDGFPLDVAAYATAEGTNNFRDSYSPGVGVLLSRAFGERGAVYLEPFWVNNTNDLPEELVDDNDTTIVGLGGRLRIRPTVYLVLEAAPRVAGFTPGVTHVSFGVEKRAGGHLFQMNVSNGLGTTLADIARGGGNSDDWFLGFTISRKFF